MVTTSETPSRQTSTPFKLRLFDEGGAPLATTDHIMFTPFVTTLVFANATAALFAWPWAAIIGASNAMDEKSRTLVEIKQGDLLLFRRGPPTEIKTDGGEPPTVRQARRRA
jgi:hypothetical protein